MDRGSNSFQYSSLLFSAFHNRSGAAIEVLLRALLHARSRRKKERTFGKGGQTLEKVENTYSLGYKMLTMLPVIIKHPG